MRKKIVFLLLAILVVGVSFKVLDDGDDFELIKNLEIYHNIMRQLRLNYVEEIDSRDLITISINNMLKTLDPYTVYYPESQIETIRMMQKSRYVGIGIKMDTLNNQFYIIEIENNSVAQKQGLQIGDIIQSVNDIDVEGKNLREVGDMLSGQEGTELSLKINRQSKIHTYTLKREVIELSVTSLVRKIDNLGYIKLESFTEESAADFKTAFLDLKSQGIDGLIIDLRNNPGGLLDQAAKIVNLFIPQNKVVVTAKGNSVGSNMTVITQQPPVDTEIPIVVLVNSHSASASEIVSGTLQDYDRAVIVGEQSYGKGLVQRIFDVGYNSQLKVTISKYYIPSGRCIQAINYFDGVNNINSSTKFYTANGRVVYEGKGIMPDVLIDRDTFPEIINDLVDNKVIFSFCNMYYNQLDTANIPAVENVSFTDKNMFVNFLKTSDFYRKIDAIKDLNRISTTEADDATIVNQVTELQKELVENYNQVILDNFQIINVLVSKEIAKRKYYHTGEIEYQLKVDTEIAKAKKILKNPSIYTSILK